MNTFLEFLIFKIFSCFLDMKRKSNMTTFPFISRFVLIALICSVFSACLNADENAASSKPVTGPGKTIAPRPPKADSPVKPELKRISENGGEVLIDGSLRVYEPIMGKVFDLVETSTPVTPASNHVRIFAVAIGTATAIKAIFDDGQIKVLGNN